MPHRSGPVRALIILGLASLLGAAVSPEPDVSATVTDLRSAKGMVVACLTARPAAFPDCSRDPGAFVARAHAAGSVELDFGVVPAGRYAISLFHDENANGKLDKRLMLPREGFGFSRDAPVRMGPPSFARAAFTVKTGASHVSIRMRYML